MDSEQNRQLTSDERNLAKWLLEHGEPEAKSFLTQLEHAEVMPWKCPCGCASLNFQIKGHDPAPPGTQVLSDYLFGSEEELSGVFIFESGSILSGIEAVGYSGAAPRCLPSPEQLRPITDVAGRIAPAVRSSSAAASNEKTTS